MQEAQSIDSFNDACFFVANTGPVRTLPVRAIGAALSSAGPEYSIDVADHENAAFTPTGQGRDRVFRKSGALGRHGLDSHSQRLQVWNQHARNLAPALDVPSPGIDVHHLLEELQLRG